VTVTEVLLSRSARLELAVADSALPWRGGFAMRWPAALPVQWTAAPAPAVQAGEDRSP
jgi:hypothetical protein